MSEVSKLRTGEAGESTAPSVAIAQDVAPQRPAGRNLSRIARRFVLLAVAPSLVLTGAAALYLQTGRVVSTENAYVKSHLVNVAPEVSGRIARVAVEENQRVDQGQLLFEIDAATFQIAVARARAAMEDARSQVTADKAAYRSALSEIRLHRTTTDYARSRLQRQRGLYEANMGTVENLDTAEYDLANALRQVEVAERKAATLLARLQGDADIPVEQHPAFLEARALHEQAQLDAQHAIVTAPFAGVVTNRPEPGEYVERGVPVLAVVSDDNMWVEANFKETQLTHMRVGQPVAIKIDAYPGYQWQGLVESMSEATGAEFALLPPQNATGNWVKIVQRLPVRIAIEQTSDAPPLRVGMSSTVSVDTAYQRSWRDLRPDSWR